MKLYPELARRQGDESLELFDRTWSLYMDVTCVDCGKVHALSNTRNGNCIKCGGKCE